MISVIFMILIEFKVVNDEVGYFAFFRTLCSIRFLRCQWGEVWGEFSLGERLSDMVLHLLYSQDTQIWDLSA